jgi:hypothetical protein
VNEKRVLVIASSAAPFFARSGFRSSSSLSACLIQHDDGGADFSTGKTDVCHRLLALRRARVISTVNPPHRRYHQ